MEEQGLDPRQRYLAHAMALSWLSLKLINVTSATMTFLSCSVQGNLVLTPTPGSAPQPGSAPSWILRGNRPKAFLLKGSFLEAADLLVRDAAATFPG